MDNFKKFLQGVLPEPPAPRFGDFERILQRLNQHKEKNSLRVWPVLEFSVAFMLLLFAVFYAKPSPNSTQSATTTQSIPMSSDDLLQQSQTHLDSLELLTNASVSDPADEYK